MRVIAIVLGSLLLLQPVQASADVSEKVKSRIRTVVEENRELKKVKISGHEFNIKPPSIRTIRIDGRRGIEITGQLSHHLNLRGDDQYYYMMKLDESGDIVEFRKRINRGGFVSLYDKVTGHDLVRRMGRIPSILIAPDTLFQEMMRGVGTFNEGSWESTAGMVALQVGRTVFERQQSTRATGTRHRDLRGPRSESPRPRPSSGTRRPARPRPQNDGQSTSSGTTSQESPTETSPSSGTEQPPQSRSNGSRRQGGNSPAPLGANLITADISTDPSHGALIQGTCNLPPGSDIMVEVQYELRSNVQVRSVDARIEWSVYAYDKAHSHYSTLITSRRDWYLIYQIPSQIGNNFSIETPNSADRAIWFPGGARGWQPFPNFGGFTLGRVRFEESLYDCNLQALEAKLTFALTKGAVQ